MMSSGAQHWITGLSFGDVIGVVCVGATIVSGVAAVRSAASAWRYAANIRAVETARWPDVSGTVILDREWFVEEALPQVQPDDAPRSALVVVTGRSCDPCRQTLNAILDMVSKVENPVARIVVVSDETQHELRQVISQYEWGNRPELHAELRQIRNVEEFRARTGIVGIPTVILIDSAGGVRGISLGAIRSVALERFGRMLGGGASGDSGALFVDRGGTGLPIMRDAIAEGTFVSEKTTGLVP